MTSRYLARTTTGVPLLGDDEGFVPLTAAAPGLQSVTDALACGYEDFPDPADATTTRIPAAHLEFGVPLEEPGKLLGIGLNYADHAADLDEERPDEPASFFKPVTSITGPGGPIRLPPADVSDRVTAEAELALVFGRTCSNVDESDIDDVIGGYVPVIDMTAEDILRRNPRFLTRAKSFDSFLVLGSTLVVPESGTDFDDVEVRTVVNDQVEARNVIANMHFGPRELASFHSRTMTFEPGDVILTGTPGAHPIIPDDSVRAEVDGFGTVAADVVR